MRGSVSRGARRRYRGTGLKETYYSGFMMADGEEGSGRKTWMRERDEEQVLFRRRTGQG